jgi:hypothetical protein
MISGKHDLEYEWFHNKKDNLLRSIKGASNLQQHADDDDACMCDVRAECRKGLKAPNKNNTANDATSK